MYVVYNKVYVCYAVKIFKNILLNIFKQGGAPGVPKLDPPLTYLGLSRLAFEHHTFSLRGEHSNGLRHRCGPWRLIPLGEKHEKRKPEQRIYQLFLDFLTNDY